MKYGYGVIILAITGFMISDTYNDGQYTKLLKSGTKYYKMAGYGFLGLSVLLFLRKNPDQVTDIVNNASDIVKYMPIDKSTTDLLTPFISAINPQSFFNKKSPDNEHQRSTDTIMNSGKKSTKRSVSETKKKFVAAQQSWICNKCKKQLPAWFEVDHKIRLEYGGSNHVDNLEALCRDCHGRKTAMENL
mgnify:CR=1 FL=1